MPIFTFICQNPECGAEREHLCKASERDTEMVWCTACEWVTTDVGVATAVEDHSDSRVVDGPADAHPRTYKVQSIMNWRGVEGGQRVKPNGGYKFGVFKKSGETVPHHKLANHRRRAW